jgi:hypothetical protein
MTNVSYNHVTTLFTILSVSSLDPEVGKQPH